MMLACACFTSCGDPANTPDDPNGGEAGNEEVDKNVVTNYYTIATDDFSWSQCNEEMEYLFSFFTDDVRMFVIEDTKTKANEQALKRYQDILDQIDNDRICKAFPTDYDDYLEEYLYAEVHLMRTVGRPDTLASRKWSIKGVEDY